MRDRFQGAEAHVEMRERAYGVATAHRPPANALGTMLRIGDTLERAPYRAGRPAARPGRSYRYCVSGGGNAAIVFGRAGRAVLTATTARRPNGSRHVLYPGVWCSGRYVYGARFLAIAAASELRSPARVRSDLRAAGV